MLYEIRLHDTVNDRLITFCLEAPCVFEALDRCAESPELKPIRLTDIELISAEPIG